MFSDLKEVLRKIINTEIKFAKAGSIGKRYLRAAEAGTPYCITVDYDSLKQNDVTIRDRDSEKQVRVKIDKIKDILIKLINREIAFESLKN